MKNPDLRSRLREHIVEALGLVQSYRYPEERNALHLFLRQRGPELRGLSTFGALERSMSEDTTVSRHLGTTVRHGNVGTRPTVESIVIGFLLRALPVGLRHEPFDDTLFTQLYEEMETYFHSDFVDLAYSAPLDNFVSEARQIDLTGQFCIKEISGEDAQALNIFPYHPVRPLPFFPPGRFMMEFVIRVPKSFGEDAPPLESSRSAFDLCEHTLSTLRLLKKGPVAYWGIVQKEVYWNPLAMWSVTHVRAPIPVW